jgi:hypothetical protein
MVSSRTTSFFLVPVALLAAASLADAQTQTLYIPQVADGGGWQTTLVISNTSSSAAPLSSMTFYEEVTPGVTQPWSLAFEETVPTTIPAGSSILLHTFGTATVTSTGWGAIAVGPGINVYAIFTQRVAGRQDQDGTGIALPAASRFLVPFDQTNGSVVGLAIANTSLSAQTVNLAARTASGAVAQAAFSVPAQGHFSFPFNSPSAAPSALTPVINAVSGESGLLEVYTTSASLAVLTLRFNVTSSFTAAPVYAEAGPPVIGTAAGSTAAPFSTLYVNGTWTLSSSFSSVIVSVFPTSTGGYTAVAESLSPFIYASFTGGTLSDQTLTFNTTGVGVYGTSAVTSGKLTLTVNNFDQVGSPVTGTMTINSTNTGSITGTSTYQP